MQADKRNKAKAKLQAFSVVHENKFNEIGSAGYTKRRQTPKIVEATKPEKEMEQNDPTNNSESSLTVSFDTICNDLLFLDDSEESLFNDELFIFNYHFDYSDEF